MTVQQLIELLKTRPQDAQVHIDDEGYPSVTGVVREAVFEGDEEDTPPTNSVLLEINTD